ncbi:MAG: iron-containing alcohol dehydrogenase [Alphaproteobacteria bacterium]|nr:iron-containing alcohol dehydrogenase [Alphaproteobacteria bacterium]
MLDFDFWSPTYFSFGRGRESMTGELVKKFGGSRVLIHYGGASAVKSGLIDRVKKSLKDAGISFVELGGVQPNPRAELVYAGIDLAREHGVDFILAVGGGSVIDSAKAIAAGAPYNGDFWDMFCGVPMGENVLPVGVVLTIAAAGSEASNGCVITGTDCTKRVFSGPSDLNRPRFAILNPELTATLPPSQVANGGADIMAHIFERYFSKTKDVETTDRLCEGLLLALIETLPRAVKNPADYEASANIMWAGMLAHNNVVGVGRKQDWLSHRLEHELSAKYDVAHGAGLAVMFPAWMRYVMHYDTPRFARFARNVWGVVDTDDLTAANHGITKLVEFWSSLGLPKNFAELGAKREDIESMADGVAALGCEGMGSIMQFYKNDFIKIYELAADAK